MQAAELGIEVGEARADARDIALALISCFRLRDSFRQRGAESDRAAAVVARRGEVEQTALGLLDLLLRGIELWS